MRNNVILLLCAFLILLMSQTPKPPKKTTICLLVESDDQVQKTINKASAEGYRVVDVTGYQDGSSQNSEFIIVLEK